MAIEIVESIKDEKKERKVAKVFCGTCDFWLDPEDPRVEMEKDVKICYGMPPTPVNSMEQNPLSGQVRLVSKATHATVGKNHPACSLHQDIRIPKISVSTVG
jgi:hypothetical protein